MEERRGWVLATFLQRLAAYLIDTVLFDLPLLVMVGSFLISIESGGPEPPEDNGVGLLRVMIGVMLGSLALLVGYAVWWLFALRRGQTPGKQMVGIRCGQGRWGAFGLGLYVPAGVRHQGVVGRLSFRHDRGHLLCGRPPVAPLGQRPAGAARQDDRHAGRAESALRLALLAIALTGTPAITPWSSSPGA